MLCPGVATGLDGVQVHSWTYVWDLESLQVSALLESCGHSAGQFVLDPRYYFNTLTNQSTYECASRGENTLEVLADGRLLAICGYKVQIEHEGANPKVSQPVSSAPLPRMCIT